MGIRVVQKAFAPPSPYGYNPGTTNDTAAGQKDRSSKHKIALFGCKSAPLDSTKLFSQPPTMQASKSKSVEGGLQIKNKSTNLDATTTTTPTAPAAASQTDKIESSDKENEDNNHHENSNTTTTIGTTNIDNGGGKSPCKVTFQPPAEDNKDGLKPSDRKNVLLLNH